MNKPKETFTVGTRVRHLTNEVCKEGVVVWKHADYTGVIDNLRGKVWNVHWSNGQRGLYDSDEIQRIPPKNIKKLVEQQITQEEPTSDEEK